MKCSILPVFLIGIFAFCIFITYRARRNQSINTPEVHSVYFLLLALFIWTLIATVLGIKGIHVSLMESVPLLWQACISVVILVIALLLSQNLISALRGIASGNPCHWFSSLKTCISDLPNSYPIHSTMESVKSAETGEFLTQYWSYSIKSIDILGGRPSFMSASTPLNPSDPSLSLA